jgi:hypothetical protein
MFFPSETPHRNNTQKKANSSHNPRMPAEQRTDIVLRVKTMHGGYMQAWQTGPWALGTRGARLTTAASTARNKNYIKCVFFSLFSQHISTVKWT